MSYVQEIHDLYCHQLAIISIDAYTEARPYPYDATVLLQCVSGGAPDTFGVQALCFAAGTYNFGDRPANYVHVSMVTIEAATVGPEIYIIEFSESPDGIAFQPIGAIRFACQAPILSTWYLPLPLRPFNNDVNGLYTHVKTALAPVATVTYSLEIKRWFPPSGARLQSGGVWPWG